jgi:hypothetical protein
MLWFDNFRLIDTGDVGQTPPPNITNFDYDARTGQLTITWQSVAGQNYVIDSTEQLGSWPTVVQSGIVGQAGTTTFTAAVQNKPQSSFHVRAAN